MKSLKLLFALFALLALTASVFGQSNKTLVLDPDKCTMTAGTTAFTAGPGSVRVAANNMVVQGTTNTTAGTITVDCMISAALRLGSAARINSINLFYGVQTTALASIGAANIKAVTYAPSTAAGAAAAGTVGAALGGTLTVTPTVLQLTTTTTGQCFNEMIRFGTPIALTSNSQMFLEQVFTTAGTTATVFQICAIMINYTEPLTSQSVN